MNKRSEIKWQEGEGEGGIDRLRGATLAKTFYREFKIPVTYFGSCRLPLNLSVEAKFKWEIFRYFFTYDDLQVLSDARE